MLSNLFLQLLGLSTYIHTITVAQVFVYNITSLAGKTSFKKEGNIFCEEKTILANTDPKQLLTLNFSCFSYLRETFPIPDNFSYTGRFSGPNRLDI